jgi:two-component system sensor histidine kinase PrrB
MSLRLRMALASALAGSVVLVLGGAAFLAAFRSDQRAGTTSLLEQQYDVVAGAAVAAARTNRPRLDSFIENRLLAPAVVRVWDGGHLLLSIGADDVDLGSPPVAEFSSVDGYAVLTRDEKPALSPARTFTVQVAVSDAEGRAALSRLRSRVRRIVLLGALASALGGWLAATAAMRPLGRLRRVTEEVAHSTDLSRRVVAEPREATEVRELALSFDEMMERLEAADHARRQALDSARTFGAAAAHELRTPLTSIGTNLEILARHPDHPERDQMLNELRADHRRVAQMLEGLRVLARGDLVGPETFSEVDLADLVERAVVDMRRRHPTDQIELESSPATVSGWADGLHVMVDNLVANALIHGRSTDGVARVRISVGMSGDHVRLVVSDDGPGIPPEERAKVKARFVRGSRVSSPGSGLGLSMVDQQAAIHLGSFQITAEPGGGARMIVEFPRVS